MIKEYRYFAILKCFQKLNIMWLLNSVTSQMAKLSQKSVNDKKASAGPAERITVLLLEHKIF